MSDREDEDKLREGGCWLFIIMLALLSGGIWKLTEVLGKDGAWFDALCAIVFFILVILKKKK